MLTIDHPRVFADAAHRIVEYRNFRSSSVTDGERTPLLRATTTASSLTESFVTPAYGTTPKLQARELQVDRDVLSVPSPIPESPPGDGQTTPTGNGHAARNGGPPEAH